MFIVFTLLFLHKPWKVTRLFELLESCLCAKFWILFPFLCLKIFVQFLHASNSHQHFKTIKIKIKRFLESLITIIFSLIVTKDTVFVWFHFLICMICFQLLLALTMLEAKLIIYLEFKLLILFLLLLLLHLLLVVASQINLHILFLYTSHYSHIYQVLV